MLLDVKLAAIKYIEGVVENDMEKVYYKMDSVSLYGLDFNDNRVIHMPEVFVNGSQNMESLHGSIIEMINIIMESGEWDSFSIWAGMGKEWIPRLKPRWKGEKARFPGVYLTGESYEKEPRYLQLSALPYKQEYVVKLIRSFTNKIPEELAMNIAGRMLDLYREFKKHGYKTLILYYQGRTGEAE